MSLQNLLLYKCDRQQTCRFSHPSNAVYTQKVWKLPSSPLLGPPGVGITGSTTSQLQYNVDTSACLSDLHPFFLDISQPSERSSTLTLFNDTGPGPSNRFSAGLLFGSGNESSASSGTCSSLGDVTTALELASGDSAACTLSTATATPALDPDPGLPLKLAALGARTGRIPFGNTYAGICLDFTCKT